MIWVSFGDLHVRFFNKVFSLINELKAVFGASHSVDQMRKDGIPGRFVQKPGNSEWIFEPVDFARNACANERICYLIACRCGAQSFRGLL